MPYKPAKRKACELFHWAISILVLLCVISAVAAVLLGVLVAKPGILALDFKTARCIVSEVTYAGPQNCDCSGLQSDDPNCKSSYPCFQIMVRYEPTRTVIRHNETESYFQNEAMIRETETDLSGVLCSYRNCDPAPRQNTILAEEFKDKYGGETAYNCLYNPYQSGQVIVRRRYNTTNILLALILPGAVFVVSLTVMACLCILKLREVKKKKETRSDNSNSLQWPRNYLGQDMPAFEADEAVENSNHLPDPFASINNMFSSETGEKNHSTKTTEAQLHDTPSLDDTRVDSVSVGVADEDDPPVIIPQTAQMSTAM